MSFKLFLQNFFSKKNSVTHFCSPTIFSHIPELNRVSYHYDCQTDMYLLQAFMPAAVIEPLLDETFSTHFSLEVDKKLLRATKDIVVHKLLA